MNFLPLVCITSTQSIRTFS
uniref:Uncharacterized protein n=1 Tax=Arundo donax TaxID=35708 RepID=A0A0A9BBW2_ARUDO